jgi:hypothetical protein
MACVLTIIGASDSDCDWQLTIPQVSLRKKRRPAEYANRNGPTFREQAFEEIQ